MVRVAGGVLVVLLGLSACGDDGTAEPPATTAESSTTTAEPTTTTTDPPPDPSVIPEDPADIDEEYVEAVLAELFHLDGEILRIARRDGPSPELRPLLEAINNEAELNVQFQLLVQAEAQGYAGIDPEPGDVIGEVEAIVIAGPSCIAADVILDYTAVGDGAATAAPTRIELRPSLVASDLNPTPWSFESRRRIGGTTALPEPCAS